VSSAKAIANKALRAFDGDEILLKFSSTSTPAAAVNQSAPTKIKKSRKKQTKASRTTSSIPPPKFRSILLEDKSARELRQNSKTALMPLLVREHAL
jgi:hypothetical protein